MENVADFRAVELTRRVRLGLGGLLAIGFTATKGIVTPSA